MRRTIACGLVLLAFTVGGQRFARSSAQREAADPPPLKIEVMSTVEGYRRVGWSVSPDEDPAVPAPGKAHLGHKFHDHDHFPVFLHRLDAAPVPVAVAAQGDREPRLT